jgi:predicted nucleic acid-binding Zn ribbon protein
MNEVSFARGAHAVMQPKKIRDFQKAGQVLAGTLERLGLAKGIQTHRAFEIWDEAVGPQVAAHARPERISNRVLRVRVDHNTWLQQLSYMKAVILSRLNERLGEGTLIDLDFRLGTVPPPADRVSHP